MIKSTKQKLLIVFESNDLKKKIAFKIYNNCVMKFLMDFLVVIAKMTNSKINETKGISLSKIKNKNRI